MALMVPDVLVERRVLRQAPPQHVEYALSALGKTLEEPLASICAWATEHASARTSAPARE